MSNELHVLCCILVILFAVNHQFPSYFLSLRFSCTYFSIFLFLWKYKCWNSCSASSSSSSSISTTLPPWSPSDAIGLNVRSLIRDGSLITADIAWHLEHEPSQCLVTWEVFGGGIKGNLLTDTSDVQISLWSDSKYHVEVTCKDKVNSFSVHFLLFF